MQYVDVIPQIFNPCEGVLFYLIHVIGCTAAATLTIKSTVAVPLVTGESFLQLDWSRMGVGVRIM